MLELRSNVGHVHELELSRDAARKFREDVRRAVDDEDHNEWARLVAGMIG